MILHLEQIADESNFRPEPWGDLVTDGLHAQEGLIGGYVGWHFVLAPSVGGLDLTLPSGEAV